MSIRKRRRRSTTDTASPSPEGSGAGALDPLNASDPDAVPAWIAFWEADRKHVEVTGEHLGTVMWNDDGAVGIRGWYY